MIKHCFEIIRRTYDRYTWLLVDVQDGRRRVVARSDRDYRSPKKVKRAIERLQGAVPEAAVVDATVPTEAQRFPLPATSFQLVSGVLPLVISEYPVAYESVKVRQSKPERRDSSKMLRKRTKEQIEVEVSTPEPAARQTVAAAELSTPEPAARHEASAAEVSPEPPAAPPAKRASRGARRKKAT